MKKEKKPKKANPYRNPYRKCPICNSNSSSLYLKATSPPPKSPIQIQVTDKYFGLHGDIVKCKNCNFAYVGKDLYVKRVAYLYKKMKDEVYIQEEKERRLSFLRILNTLEKLSKRKSGKILDIGCCTGFLLSEAKKRGWEVFGVDPSIWACEIAKRRHGLDIYNGTFQSFGAKKESFDAIVLLDVLEHVQNPQFFLTKINKLLKKDGVFCLVTPNYGSIMAKMLGERWWGIRLAHLSYFRFIDLEVMFSKTGFQIVKTKTYIRYFSLYYILVRLFPYIEKRKIIKSFLKRISVPLIFFDTFELYLKKNSSSIT